MFAVRGGKTKMARRSQKRVLLLLLLLLPVVILITVILQKYIKPVTDEFQQVLSKSFDKSSQNSSANSCPMPGNCPEKHFSFYIQSGAANAAAPKICFQAQMVLGTVMNNAGLGINIVIINGKTGEVLKTGNFDMYSGDVKELLEFLSSIETGTIVLMASFDDSASKLNDEGRTLITQLGSSMIQSLGFRDNWVFVGGKGAAVTSHFEKFKKNDAAVNRYEAWPELIGLEGCIPSFPE
ncbi:protein FAM3C-like isoform X1 [Hippoglossus hippoglossus]|uniref:protein FAM3C-like isoform X1 n=1 Tax=Hippoglossus hippoglossus TaxID=8267 RepID=UPI00148CB5EA|nr:protein FAM3C-like isoform X1 [Hippoglossus hippoglossus]